MAPALHGPHPLCPFAGFKGVHLAPEQRSHMIAAAALMNLARREAEATESGSSSSFSSSAALPASQTEVVVRLGSEASPGAAAAMQQAGEGATKEDLRAAEVAEARSTAFHVKVRLMPVLCSAGE